MHDFKSWHMWGISVSLVCVCVCVCGCVSWLSWELSPQMGVQLFLNELNYRDGNIHQNWAPSGAQNSSVAAEKQFGASCSSSVCLPSHTLSQKTLRIYVWEPGDDGSSTLCGVVFSSTMQPTGSMAPQPRLISSFSTLFRLIWFSALSVALSSEQRRLFPVSCRAFSQLNFWEDLPRPVPHYASIFVRNALVAADIRSDATARLTYCHRKLVTLAWVSK